MIARGWQDDRARLERLIEKFVNLAEPSWAVISERERVLLRAHRDLPTIAWANTLDGVLFGPRGELRWRNDGGTAHVRAIIAESTPLPAGTESDVALSDPEPAHFYLLGTCSGRVWQESRLPVPLDYGVRAADGSRLVIEGRLWHPSDVAGDIHQFLQVRIDDASLG